MEEYHVNANLEENLEENLRQQVVAIMFISRYGYGGSMFILCSILFPWNLYESSFYKHQIKHNTPVTDALFFGIFSAVLVFCVFAPQIWTQFMKSKMQKIKSYSKTAMECYFTVIIWLFLLLIKFPRFYGAASSSFRQDIVISGGPYTLVSVGAFALSALLLSDKDKFEDLGLFGIFVELIMTASLEITTVANRPSLAYVLSSFLYCVALIFLKHVLENSIVERRLRVNRNDLRAFRKYLVFYSTLVGMVCLFLSPFTEAQFGEYKKAKAICFVICSLILGGFLWKAREFIAYVSAKCSERWWVRFAVRFAAFAIISLFIFVTKYPRFHIRSKSIESIEDQPGWSDESLTVIFLFFVMSTYMVQPVSNIIFGFSVGLTMDTAMEDFENDTWGIIGFINKVWFCFIFILIKSLLDHFY